MISLTTNTRGMTAMNAMNFSTMSGPQLVKAFNDMAAKAGALPVKRFATTAAGIRRCQELAKKTNGAAKPVKKAADDKRSSICVEFGARAGTVRESLLNALHDSFRKQVAVSTLLKCCYGSVNMDNTGALTMSIKGALAMIEKNKLPYQIKKEKNDAKEISFGLYPKQ